MTWLWILLALVVLALLRLAAVATIFGFLARVVGVFVGSLARIVAATLGVYAAMWKAVGGRRRA